jgi:hypothetical protein
MGRLWPGCAGAGPAADGPEVSHTALHIIVEAVHISKVNLNAVQSALLLLHKGQCCTGYLGFADGGS